jgi:hypothetical protein
MAEFGDVGFGVFFDGIEVGDGTGFTDSPNASVTTQETWSALRNRINKRNKGGEISIDRLDFNDTFEIREKLEEMIIDNKYINQIVQRSQKRDNDGKEFIQTYIYSDCSVITERSFSVTDDWTQGIKVTYEKREREKNILI